MTSYYFKMLFFLMISVDGWEGGERIIGTLFMLPKGVQTGDLLTRLCQCSG
nr:hypothetical protein [Mucilaginibacter sp. FT3.2]